MQSKTLFLLGLCTILSTTASAVPLDAKGAKQQLNQAAKQKVFQGKINLDALVTNESNDLIVEYNIPSESVATGLERRNYIAANKKNIQSRFNRGVGVQVLRDYNNLPIAFYRISNKEALVDLLNDPNVKAVYPNRINQATTMESLPLINQPQANTKGFNGTGSSVAVLDTGVNYLHSDFGCTAVNSPSSTCRVVYAFDSAPDDGSLDDNGHGSNVSAIVSKVATKTKIIGIDVFRSGSAYDSDILAGINWAVNNAKTYNIKAINLSLGIPGVKYKSECSNSSYATAFANARAAGVVPVVASGNDAFSDGISSPACVAGAVRVGAVYDSNIGGVSWGNPVKCSDPTTAADKVACFSNGGSLVTLLAPGAMITAGGYTMGGTSQATPHVAGAIALLRANSVTPTETIDQTINRLKTTGKPITDSRTGLVFPRIDLLAATNGLTVN
ncbi:subtilase family protein [Acinetobacter sp. 1130196]|uniref:S8 family peptidase n=1 Tax=Acinetobacter calcoaceticus/baumannii complex TaxID=909768 RepID=UPI0004468A36|nr:MULTISPECIES: S8 family serine peptidase [Acinetobacter calcoaceticus/baumannii complex]EKU6037051.1 S8 family serine peptidase [Acinetobacter nosocomialis]EXE71413.1 subtilase family protein [Acinetobacter sp. 1566109]EXR08449.1 subtilase family protein [Acinetobacter sp. 1130196]MBJ9959027.1 S8 family serine peptidase [Acinetobacter nosocomialis]MBP1478405.1 S8 family serine peptidase [Acinetobacter nosocomialis]